MLPAKTSTQDFTLCLRAFVVQYVRFRLCRIKPGEAIMDIDFSWLKNELRLGALSDEDKVALAEVFEAEFVPEGFPIIHQGTSVQHLYLLRSGSVTITQKHVDHVVTLDAREEAKTFGEISFFGDEAAIANVIADQPCEVYKVSCENFRYLMQQHPGMALKLMAFIVRSMGEVIRRLDSSIVWH